jgi:hypothetical protein
MVELPKIMFSGTTKANPAKPRPIPVDACLGKTIALCRLVSNA